MTPTLAFLALLVFGAASFFFALAELSLFSLGKGQVRKLAEENPPAGLLLNRLVGNTPDLLAAIVLGNTFANAALVAIMFWVSLQEKVSIPFTVAFLLAVVLVGGEVIPKALAVRAPEFWALRLVRPMVVFVSGTRALRWVAQTLNDLILRGAIPNSVKPQTGLSDEEYKELLELGYQQGSLAAAEKEIILQIINLDRKTAKDVMKPRSQMACIPDDLTVEEMIAAARQHKRSRLPVYDETPDAIVGVLNTRSLLLDPAIDLSEAIEFPSFVPESMNLLQLLKSLQRQQRGLAIVLDEFGGTAGVVTMEDILEEIVGEIRTEGDVDTFIMEKVGENKWRVSGNMRIDDLRREFPALGEVETVETLGGLLVQELEVVPAVGQTTVFRGVRLTAQSVDDRRVRELLVESAGNRT